MFFTFDNHLFVNILEVLIYEGYPYFPVPIFEGPLSLEIIDVELVLVVTLD